MAETTVSNDQALMPKQDTVPTTREDERYLVPAVDIYETEDALTLLADMPGVVKDGIDIRVEEGILTIKGRQDHVLRPGDLHREFELLDYYRQFSLTEDVDCEKITAVLKNGVLTLSLAKVERAKPKKIEVKIA